MTQPVLAARAVHVRVGTTDAVRGVDLELHAGEVLALLGPSGAGKSTLFRLLVGDLEPNAGSVWLADRDVTRWPLWRRARAGLGYVPQTPSVLGDLDVDDNLATFARLTGTPLQRARDTAARLGLAGRARVVAGRLSGGERRRLELARALIAGPRVLVLDEPLAGLDPASITAVSEAIDAARADGAAVLLADHRVPEALAVATRALLMAEGRIEVSAAPDEFREHQAVRRRYL